MPTARIVQADVLALLKRIPDNTFHGCLTDPPYGLNFMGKKWDYDIPSIDVWREILRVLKPGAGLLSFGGSRTYHRIACGIEDAGFELRDEVMWLYAKGMPKGQNVSLAIDKAAGAERPIIGYQTLTGNAAVSTREKGGTYGVQVGTVPPKTVPITGPATDLARLWDGYGTNLKPCHEPIALARKPLEGTMAENLTKYGCGPLAIDASRVEGDRWPPNVAMDEEAGAFLDAQVGERPSNPYPTNRPDNTGLMLASMGERSAGGLRERGAGPSRFFFSAKVSTREREAGCEHLPKRSAGQATGRKDGSKGLENPHAGAGRTGGARNIHPTLKPLALNKWLAGLIRPPVGGFLLVPYAGAGSEMIGALQAGWDQVLGIELDAENEGYLEIARARLAHWVPGCLA